MAHVASAYNSRIVFYQIAETQQSCESREGNAQAGKNLQFMSLLPRMLSVQLLPCAGLRECRTPTPLLVPPDG